MVNIFYKYISQTYFYLPNVQVDIFIPVFVSFSEWTVNLLVISFGMNYTFHNAGYSPIKIYTPTEFEHGPVPLKYPTYFSISLFP